MAKLFYENCTILNSFQQSVEVLVVPHSCQHLVYLLFVILMGVQWYLFVFSNFSSIMTHGVENYFMCLFAVPNMFFLKNVYSDLLPI